MSGAETTGSAQFPRLPCRDVWVAEARSGPGTAASLRGHRGSWETASQGPFGREAGESGGSSIKM